MKRHPASRASGFAGYDGRTPDAILPTLDQLATEEGLSVLIDLASCGRNDTNVRICWGPTWTNVAQRALHLIHAVVSDLSVRCSPDELRRIRDIRAEGVNWVFGRDDSGTGHAIFNFGTFEFDTTELRRTANLLLKQQHQQGIGPTPKPKPKLSSRLRRVEQPSAPVRPVAPAIEEFASVIEEQQQAVRREPTSAEPYRALYKLFVHTEQFDRAWCVSQALTLLGKANDSERRYFEGYRPKGLLTIKSRLDSTLWKAHICHRDQSGEISQVFEVLAPAALKLKIHQLRARNQLSVMDEQFKQDPKGSTVSLVKTFGWAAEVFGIRCPDLYVRNDLPGALAAVPMRPPASLAGSTVCSGLQPQELAFVVGKHMSFYRSEHYVRCLYPDARELATLFFAALSVAGVDGPLPPDLANEATALGGPLAKCVDHDRIASLRQAIHHWLQGGAAADFARWSQAVELTACRAGLLLSGDLGAAWAMITAEPQAPSDLSPEEKLKDLFVYSVSGEYFGLRNALGITL